MTQNNYKKPQNDKIIEVKQLQRDPKPKTNAKICRNDKKKHKTTTKKLTQNK